jgi:hypothetical protein
MIIKKSGKIFNIFTNRRYHYKNCCNIYLHMATIASKLMVST